MQPGPTAGLRGQCGSGVPRRPSSWPAKRAQSMPAPSTSAVPSVVAEGAGCMANISSMLPMAEGAHTDATTVSAKERLIATSASEPASLRLRRFMLFREDRRLCAEAQGRAAGHGQGPQVTLPGGTPPTPASAPPRRPGSPRGSSCREIVMAWSPSRESFRCLLSGPCRSLWAVARPIRHPPRALGSPSRRGRGCASRESSSERRSWPPSA